MADLDDLAHLPEDEEALLNATLGDELRKALDNPKSPFSQMMERARAEYTAGVLALIDADLHTKEGIADAIRVQAHATRYRDMCRWIRDALEKAALADAQLLETADVDEPAIEELMEQRHGKRGKPAFDA